MMSEQQVEEVEEVAVANADDAGDVLVSSSDNDDSEMLKFDRFADKKGPGRSPKTKNGRNFLRNKLKILRLRNAGVPNAEIAKMFKIDRTALPVLLHYYVIHQP